ncbi:RNP-1 like RNA-binding protein [Neoconidiobolus thromboides FSU 785]|nr:RNP-1 like RNA-binding protein [Neoconidiobolus thromboides FSU 785]
MSLFKSLIATSMRSYATKSLFVGNMPYKATAEDLSQLFEKYDVSRVTIPNDELGRGRGFAFVEIEEEFVDQAISENNEQEFQGRRIRVSEAANKPRFSKQ